MKEEGNSDYQIIIIQCCENCETHQSFARHSEWKYFEQFNELKRKIEKFIPNTVVIKNPVPDELVKTPEIAAEKNMFVNKDTGEKIIFPRIGSFEIYVYNILLSSKLMTNQWPNHYKILQVIAKMIEDKKKGMSLEQYSVYNDVPQQQQQSKPVESPEKKNHRIVSKKKKAVSQLTSKAYRSIEKPNPNPNPKSTLDPLATKLVQLDNPPARKQRFISRYLQSKADNRIKLPSLNNSVSLREESSRDPQSSNQRALQEEKERSHNNTIDLIDTSQVNNAIQRNVSEVTEGQKVSLLELRQESHHRNYMDMTQELESDALKFLQNRSVQYSQQYDAKEFMSRSIQYQQEEGFFCDFGLQVDNEALRREQTYHFVQTDKIEVLDQPKPETEEQSVSVNIVLVKPQAQREIQTTIREFVDETVGTDVVGSTSRGFQYPQEVVKAISDLESIDSNYQHLFQKRRNIIDNEYYSVDRFQEKSTKYKWIGRANPSQNQEQLKRRLFLECLVFSVYNYFGVKTPERRLSYQSCANVVGDRMKESALHVLTSENPEFQYPPQFQECNPEQEKYPLSEVLTFRNSRQQIRFANYGGLLAIAYFLNDKELFVSGCQLGLVVVNQAVKEIHKLSALNYVLHPAKGPDDQIAVSPDRAIKLARLSQAVELEFFAMLSRLTDQNSLQEMLRLIRETFLHATNAYPQFRTTLLSLKLERAYENQTVEDFIAMIEARAAKVEENFRGKLYTYRKYHTLSPIIKYTLPFQQRVERRLLYKDKSATLSDIVKHVRNKDNLVVLEGEDGSGKSTLLADLARQLKENQKLNVLEFSELRREKDRLKDELFQLTKNIVLIDNSQAYQPEALALLDRYSKGNFEVSFCVATSQPKQADIFKNRYPSLTVVQIKILPLDAQEIRGYLMKSVKNQSFTAKKELVDRLVATTEYLDVLGNTFFLSLYSNFLSRNDLEKYELRSRDLSRYMMLKEHFSHCTTQHADEVKAMGLSVKEVLPNLRRLAFEYYHNGLQPTQITKDILAQYQQNELIRSQLVYYPLNLDAAIATSYQPLFTHGILLRYFLVQAYCYFLEKGYRNMKMDVLLGDSSLLALARERYRLEDTYNQLVEVVLASKRFRNTAEASSNAITLLAKMGFVFSNMNFDDCNISEADLSAATFYQCSFRGADLERTILYKAQMISCVFDNATMTRINLFSRKYEIEFAATAASLSVDGKKLAFGCGNYLIVVNADTGAEMKRIEAHLDVIRLVRYTRDGNSLITVADDKTLRIWDIYTFKSVVFKLPQKGSISYSNETETIASVNKNSLKVWNLKSMANEAELEGHTEAITTVQFSVDGERILTGSKDTTLRLWTLRGQQKFVYKGHDSEIIAGKLSPARRTMVSSSRGKDIIMWQVESGNKLLSKKFMNEVTEICLDDKEKYVIVTFSGDNHLVVLDFLTFDIIHVLTGHQAKIVSLSFDHHFRQLVSLGKDRTARVWQFDKIMQSQSRSPKITKKIHKGPVLALAYDKTKKRYATSHQNGEINFWGAQENNHLDQVFSHNGPVRCLIFDRASKLYSGGSDGTLRIWALQNKRQPRNLQIYSSQMLQLKLSEKNRLIASSSAANELVVYDFTGIKILMSTREEGRVNAIEFSNDQRIMAVGGAEKYVVLYDISSSNAVTRGDQLGVHNDAVSSLCFFGDTLLVVALKNGQVAIWNHQKVNLIKKIQNLSPIRDIIAFQKKYICFTSDDGKARIVNMDEGREIKVFRFSELPMSIDTNQDDSLLYVGCNDGNTLIWNLNCVKPTGKKIEFDRKAIDVDCTKIVTVQSGRTLLIKDLFYHKEETIQVKIDSDIQGVTFDDNRIILLLKNGKYWQLFKKQYKFNSNNKYEGDLFFIRDRNYTNFFKSGLKKIKGMNKPALAVLEEVNS